MAEFAVAVTFWPIVVTKVTDLIRNLVGGLSTPKWVWNLVSMGLGVAVALLYELNYAALIPNLPPRLQGATGVMAQIITGLGIGALGSFWHELMDMFSGKAKAAKAATPEASQD